MITRKKNYAIHTVTLFDMVCAEMQADDSGVKRYNHTVLFCFVQLSQAGDLIIEVYLEKKIPDCCITLKVNRLYILYLQNIQLAQFI